MTQTAASTSSSRKLLIVNICFAIAVLVPSLYGFSGKFLEFVHLFRGNSDGVFAITPILNYLLASAGFFCLFFWAMLHGMFHDVERPKVTMLDIERQLDETGHATAPQS
jgi:hypothetical protein